MDISLFNSLRTALSGDLFTDDTTRTLYATDASAYREKPVAVAIPQTENDILKLINFANKHQIGLIPRTAGTSLAGQVVGGGIVVDVSKHFTNIVEINAQQAYVRLQPALVRDDLNKYLLPHQLFFAPETSTANRAMIGGMVGNNSCGSNSVVYGSTREHLLEVRGFLADGSEVIFKDLDEDEFNQKCNQSNLEGALYRQLLDILSNEQHRTEIKNQFPKATIPRRNTGYALDLLLDNELFSPRDSTKKFNLCQLIAGSEGTLFFITELKLKLTPLPPRFQGLLCVHFNSIDEALRANLIALQHNPSASELIDHYVLECTKANIEQRQNRFFLQGDPQAILAIEISRNSLEEVQQAAQNIEKQMREADLGFHFPLIVGEDVKKVWSLRKAGLGLLSNMVGDAKPVAVIEDTAVDVVDLPAYIREFNIILKNYNLYAVHYAHAGSGELHLRPILDLKTQEGNDLFRSIAQEVATLVKKYKGSLSGEHGDGRLRGEFIQQMVGEKVYELFKEIKYTWDKNNIFNPHKIVHTPPMNTFLRYEAGQKTPQFDTVMDFSGSGGILRAAEMCNGSGDCRKTHLSGGVMCPSYMATRNEKDTTRARANILREILTHSEEKNPFANEQIYSVMDLCLSCKGCKSECPSNVDVAKLKAEFLHQYYQQKGVPFRTLLIGNFTRLTALAALMPRLYNALVSNSLSSALIKKIAGFAPKRSMPLLHATTLQSWWRNRRKVQKKETDLPTSKKKIYLFIDEFTNFNDVTIGIKAVELLEKLGYEVEVPLHLESGRAFLSKGLLTEAKDLAVRNIDLLKGKISAETPLIGIEPSAILTFRDEYLDLANSYQKDDAKNIARHTFLFEEFISKEIALGNIKKTQFTTEKRLIKLHGHCMQKSLSSMVDAKKALSLPANYEVQLIPSGCCGMAGSFGYESEHYALSMQIGELVLFPTVRQQADDVLIAAAGTSCRHQIKDGTNKRALHPIEILWEALIK